MIDLLYLCLAYGGNYRTSKITWFVTVIALYIIGFIQKYEVGGGNIFLTLANSSVILSFLVERYYLSKVNEDSGFIKFIGLVLILTTIILLVVWLLSR